MTNDPTTLLIGMLIMGFIAAVAIVFVVIYMRERERETLRHLDTAETRREKYLTDVLDRFLARNMGEMAMAQVIRSEAAEVPQDELSDLDGEAKDDQTFREFLVSEQARLQKEREEAVASANTES